MTCETKLLPDVPSDDDQLGGSHERIVQALYQLILAEDEGGKSIGLEGDYGSGKSTIINILEKRLKSTNQKTADCEVIVFDLWALEGDPLRRAFLEYTIRHLIDREWIDKAKWENQIEILAQRRESKTTETTPEITRMGKIFGFLLFLVPIGLAVLNASLRDNLTIDFSADIDRKFALGLILAFSPIIFLILNWVTMRLRGNEGQHQFWTLLYKAITKETTETIKTPNPTALEFEDVFRQLMEEALNNKSRRLVFVFDNLDRVGPKAALDTWSTLQTFVGQTYSHFSNWSKQVWVIVSFDPHILETHFFDETKPTQNIETGSFTGFIEKTFQIRFHVPPPLLSKWKRKLMDFLDFALPDHRIDDPEKREQEFHRVYRVYETFCSSRSIPIRKLKLFINQIGVVHRQWQDRFPLSHIAYFALNQKEIIKQKLNHYVDPRYENIFEESKDVMDNLMAMAFNVDKEIAREVLIAPEIKNALLKGNHEQLREFEAKLASFWEVTETLFTKPKEWIEFNESLANVAFTFSESQLLDGRLSKQSTKTIRDSICQQGKETTVWTNFDKNTAKAILGIWRWTNDQYSHENILKAILEGLTNDKGTPHEFHLDSLLEGLKLILSTLNKSKKQAKFVSSLIKSQIENRLKAKHVDGEARLKVSAPIGTELVALLSIISNPTLQDLLFEKQNVKLADAETYLYFLNYTFDKNLSDPRSDRDAALDIIALCLLRIFEDEENALSNIVLDPDNKEFDGLHQILTMSPNDNVDKERFSLIPDYFAQVLPKYKRGDPLYRIFRRAPYANLFIKRCKRAVKKSDFRGRWDTLNWTDDKSD